MAAQGAADGDGGETSDGQGPPPLMCRPVSRRAGDPAQQETATVLSAARARPPSLSADSLAARRRIAACGQGVKNTLTAPSCFFWNISYA